MFVRSILHSSGSGKKISLLKETVEVNIVPEIFDYIERPIRREMLAETSIVFQDLLGMEVELFSPELYLYWCNVLNSLYLQAMELSLLFTESTRLI